jgi:hypothetical protein
MPVVRMAFFEGAFKPGLERAFFDYAHEFLVPLWTSFPGLQSFRMMPGGGSDDGAHAFVLMLEFTYPDHAAMETALASPARMQSREVTKKLFDFFDGRISHIVVEAVDFAPRPAV